jgi:hypothetical protein
MLTRLNFLGGLALSENKLDAAELEPALGALQERA